MKLAMTMLLLHGDGDGDADADDDVDDDGYDDGGDDYGEGAHYVDSDIADS